MDWTSVDGAGVGSRWFVALTIEDRERIGVLDDVRTEALAELRAALLQEHEWRTKEGWLV